MIINNQIIELELMFLKFYICILLSIENTVPQIVASRKVIKTKSKYNEQAELANQVVWRSNLYMSQPPKANNSIYIVLLSLSSLNRKKKG